MTWENAFLYAAQRQRQDGRKRYVRGYRTSLGRWRYGAYDTPRPRLVGRDWS